MKRVWVRKCLVAGAMVLLAAAREAEAQTRRSDLGELPLEELLNMPVVTATRTTEGAATAPARVEVVTAADIERRGYRSLADVLRDLPGIKVDYAVDQDLFSDITIQGTRGTPRTIVLLDGVRISSPTGEPLPILANYPVHSAKQIEVVYGPASALYGADAFSAVINIISRAAGDGERLRVSSSVGEAGLANTTASFASSPVPGATLLLAGQWFSDDQPDLSTHYPEAFGGMPSHRTGVFNTIYGPMRAGPAVSPQYSLPVRASSVQAVFDTGSWRLGAFKSHSRTPNTPAYTPENAVYNDIAFHANDLFVGTVSYRRYLGAIDTSSTLTFSRHELEPESGYLNVYSGMQRSYKYAYGSSIRAEHQAKWTPAPRLSLTGGGEIAHLRGLPQTADLETPIAKRGDVGTILGTTMADELFDIRYWDAGVFLNAQWSLTPQARITAGLRADSNSQYSTVFNPRVGFVSTIARRTTLKALYGSAYLAPSPYQMYSHYGSFYSVDGGQTYQSDFWHVPNPQLKPQRKHTAELLVDHSLGGVVSLGGSVFYSRFTDFVQEADITSRRSGLYRGWPVALIQQSFNSGRETTFGGTLQADYLVLSDVARFRLRTSLSLAEGHVAEESAPGGTVESGGMSPLLFQMIGDFDHGAWSLSPRLIAVGPQRTLAIATAADGSWRRRTIEGHAVVNLSARRRFSRLPVDVFANAENLLDARFRHVNLRAFTNPEEMAGSVQNPRRLSFGIDVRIR